MTIARTLYRRSPHGHARVNGSVDQRLAGWLIRTHTQAKSRSIRAALDAADAAAHAAANDGRPVAAQQGDSDSDDATAPMLAPGDKYSTAFEAEMRSQGFPHFVFWSRRRGRLLEHLPSGYYQALQRRAKRPMDLSVTKNYVRIGATSITVSGPCSGSAT